MNIKPELHDKMKTIVEVVSKKYPGGESYFNELDDLVKNDESFIIEIINSIVKEKNCNIVSTGEFGFKIAELLERNEFKEDFKLLVFNGGIRKGDAAEVSYSNGESNNYTGWYFIDDSYYSGKTLNAIRRKLESKFNIAISGAFAFYDGSTNHMVESLYSYWR